MARNKVQFQRSLSDVEFERHYGTRKNAARHFLLALAGRLRVSGVRGLGALRARKACTVAVQRLPHPDTKLGLRVWFRTTFHMTQNKQGLSPPRRQLQHRLGDASQAQAGDAGAQPGQAARRPHRDGRCLSRRGVQRRQVRTGRPR
jgi:hypothetical protein